MKDKIESFIYYPVYLIKEFFVAVSSFTTGFIKGFKQPH